MSTAQELREEAAEYPKLMAEYLVQIKSEKESAQTFKENFPKLVESAQKAIKNGNLDILEKVLNHFDKSVSAIVDCYIETLQELEDAKVEGGDVILKHHQLCADLKDIGLMKNL